MKQLGLIDLFRVLHPTIIKFTSFFKVVHGIFIKIDRKVDHKINFKGLK